MDEELQRILEGMSLTDIVRLQDQLSVQLRSRYAHNLALIFTDIAGSTSYFSQFGDEAGRRMQQRHVDTLEEALAPRGGRIVDTAGDGAFAVVSSAQDGAAVLVEVMRKLDVQNDTLERAHRMFLRCGLHWGQVLTDGDVVTGDSVNLVARVAGAAKIDEICITRATFNELSHLQRLDCRPMGPTKLKGLSTPVDVLTLNWLDRALFPGHVEIAETSMKHDLPNKSTIAFGRLAEHEGMMANDIVLAHHDPNQTAQISRWHFELRRSPDGYMLRPLGRGIVEVDDQVITQGNEIVISTGSVVRVARVLTLKFLAGHSRMPESSATMFVHE